MSSESPFPADRSLGKPVCVFCGSSPGTSALYTLAAQSVGAALAQESIPLVYGGGRRGIMGVVSQAGLDAGGFVHGVLPRALIERASERTPAPSANGAGTPASGPVSSQAVKSKEGLGQDLLQDNVDGRLTMEVTGSMHSRKMKMAQLSTGGFVVLPGGYGTYEEMMEMVTWNQLGIHRLPVLILNIGNFYTPLRGLLENAVNAGFVAPQNLSLCHIVDLPGGSAANIDESRAGEWGPATIAALKAFNFDAKVGYGLNWKEPEESQGESSSAAEPGFSLFTTMRYTNDQRRRVRREDVPLIDLHIARLREAHAYFARNEPIWGEWPGDAAVWETIRSRLDEAQGGDWRVRVVLHIGARLEVQVVPAPGGAGPFCFEPESSRSARRRPIFLDPTGSTIQTERAQDKEKRLYKTTDRKVYDDASARGGRLHPEIDHPEVLLHDGEHVLETVTSNIALYVPSSTAGGPQWVTPRLDEHDRPFLHGVMRRHLLDRGILREGELSVEDWKAAKGNGTRIIGFNGLRGVWEAEIV